MSTLPSRNEIRPTRCHSWQKHTNGHRMITLAEQASALLQEDQDNVKRLSFRFDSFRRNKNPSFPELGACVAVESIFGLARGQVYRAITDGEEERQRVLEGKFGELPLRFDEANKTYYGDGSVQPPPQMTLNYRDFASMLNSRGIITSQLAKAIGRKDVSIQKLSRWKGMGAKGDDNAIPEDFAADVKEGIRKIEAGEITFEKKPAGPAASAPLKEDRESQIGSEIHIVGLGGLDIPLATTLNFQDLHLEDDKGNVLIQNGTLHIPPLPLSDAQRQIIRQWIANTIAGKMVQ